MKGRRKIEEFVIRERITSAPEQDCEPPWAIKDVMPECHTPRR
jgi:hypothetical protein